MSKLFRLEVLALLSAFTFSFVSCSSEDEVEDVLGTVDPIDPITGEEIATINLTEGGADTDVFYAQAKGEAGGTVQGRVIFTAVGDSQKRLYVTKTLPGGSAEPFEIPELTNKELKADESIDLDGDAKDAIDFTFDLDVPSDITDGSIVYNFWSTSGKGDFTDASKRLLIGVGTIEVSIGTGENPEELVRTFNGVKMLQAPLGDGSSNTFISLLNGQIFTINQGSEFVALWDFGYYYGNTGLASFASANDYPSSIVDIVEVANSNTAAGDETITNEDLNVMYFTKSLKTVDDFNAITLSSELDVIIEGDSQTVNQLEVNDIIEFVDNSGIKGLIKVNNITGTNGSSGSITFDIKAQQSVIPIQL